MENIADFVSAYIIGNLLQMAFRFWAFRRWVFPDEFGRNPDKAVEATITAGGIAEALEDELEAHDAANGHPAAPARRASGAGPARLSSATPRDAQGVEDFVIQQ